MPIQQDVAGVTRQITLLGKFRTGRAGGLCDGEKRDDKDERGTRQTGMRSASPLSKSEKNGTFSGRTRAGGDVLAWEKDCALSVLPAVLPVPLPLTRTPVTNEPTDVNRPS